MICHVAVTVAARGYNIIVAKVVAVCAAPCLRFCRYNTFLLLFQKEQSQGTPATTATSGTMELTGGSAIFYGWKYPLAIS